MSQLRTAGFFVPKKLLYWQQLILPTFDTKEFDLMQLA